MASSFSATKTIINSSVVELSFVEQILLVLM